MSAELHHAAVVARLQADAQLATAVFEVGEVPEPAPDRYVVVSSSLGDRSQARFSGGKIASTTTHYVYCVGLKAAQARWVAGRVETQLLDFTLTIAGRSVRRPADWFTRPVVVDKDGPFPLPYGVIVFDLYSEPSS